MQTLLFEDDAEIAYHREMILVHCDCAGLSRHVDGSRLWIKTKSYLDKVADLFGVTAWDEIQTLNDVRELYNAVHYERHGHSSF